MEGQQEDPPDPDPEQSLAELVVELYQEVLIQGYLISSSFKNILENKLDRIKRNKNLLYILFLFIYEVPRYSFLGYLNFRDEETKTFYRYHLADTFNEFGTFGQIINIGFAIFAFLNALDRTYLYVFESKARLDFLTNMLSLMEESDESKETLGKQEKKQLLLKMKRKLLILRMSIKMMCCSVFLYELIGTPLFLLRKPSFFVGLYAVINMVIMLILVRACIYFVLTIYATYVLTADYFTARMDYISSQLDRLRNDLTKNRVKKVLFLYNELLMDFSRQDYLLKYLLRNLIYSYCIALAVLFLLFTIEVHPYLRPFLLTGITVLGLGMMLAGLYVGRLQSRVMGLYEEFNQVFARNCFNRRFRLKMKRNLLNCIKELGSQQTDGQFVLGLRDGQGAATSSLEMFDLTMDTVGNTLMFMGFI